LDASRIAAGRLELELEEVNLAEVAEEVGLRFRDEAARLGSPLGVRAPIAAIGYWDRGRVDQVISNLVANAIKYGEGKPIEIAVETTSDRAVLAVRDNGVGIALGDHERIFGRFERAVSSRNYGGIGVGLWTVKQIVDALAGTITVDSQPGMGATFTVALPRAATSARFGASLGERRIAARG
jgi:signal transduction histidine kinase